jgi:hypothetical protein
VSVNLQGITTLKVAAPAGMCFIPPIPRGCSVIRQCCGGVHCATSKLPVYALQHAGCCKDTVAWLQHGGSNPDMCAVLLLCLQDLPSLGGLLACPVCSTPATPPASLVHR